MIAFNAQSITMVILGRSEKRYSRELRSCVKVAALGSPSQIFLMVSVDVKQH